MVTSVNDKMIMNSAENQKFKGKIINIYVYIKTFMFEINTNIFLTI